MYKPKVEISGTMDRFLEHRLDELAQDNGYVSALHMGKSKNQEHLSIFHKKYDSLIKYFLKQEGFPDDYSY